MTIDIEYLELISKIKLSQEEKETFETELLNTIKFVGGISEVEDLEDLKKQEAVSISELRDDEIIKDFSREDILLNAPKQKDGCFVTPLVVE